MTPAEFDLHARLEDEHWWFRARREIVFDLLCRQLPPSRAKRVLEIGCGTGGNLRLLSAHYAAMGTEIDPYAARLAARRAGCEIRCGDIADALEGVDFVPDAVLMLDVLEHVRDDRLLLTQALALLPAGGRMVLTVPADERLWSGHDVVLGHYRRYSRAGFAALWRELQVETLLLSGFNALLYPAVRLARKLRGRHGSSGSDLAPVNPLLNAILYRVFAIERHLLARVSLPWGCSLIAILRKSGS